MRQKIHVVANNDLEKFLDSLNLLEDLQINSLQCSICKETLSLDSIGCIYPFQHEIKICCDQLLCLQKVIDLITPIRRIDAEDTGEEESK